MHKQAIEPYDPLDVALVLLVRAEVVVLKRSFRYGRRGFSEKPCQRDGDLPDSL